MKIVIGADPAGYPLKAELKDHLLKQGKDVIDIGMVDPKKEIPYYEVAAVAAKKVQSGEADRAILCCGTGMGVSIVANKFKGVYAGVVESEFTGERCKIINDANILCFGCWVISPHRAKKAVDLWLDASFAANKKELEPFYDFLKSALVEVKKIEAATMK